MTRSNLVRSSLVLAAAALLSAPASAQNEAEIRADLEFARGLATDWSFVGLATEVLDDARAKHPSGKLLEELALAECEVYAQGARIERDDARRNTLFLEALDRYKGFLDRYSSSELRAAAETGLVSTAVNFSKSVEISLETLSGAEAEELNKQKIDVLEDAVKLTAELIQAISDTPPDERTAQQKADAASLMLNRGRMLKDIGAAQENGTYFFEQAIMTLENMVFFFGEGTPQALEAYNALGDVYLAMGNIQDAYYMYEGVLNQAWPADESTLAELIKEREDQGDPITDSEWARRYYFLELSMEGLLECTLDLGQTERACAFAMHYYDARQQKGLTWSVPQGYSSLLKCAEVFLEAGGYIGGNQTTGDAHWYSTEEEMKKAVRSRRLHDTAISFALKLANIVNTENKGNFLQVRAQKLIAEIANRPGVVVSVDVLIQAAEGKYYDGDYPGAVEAFKRVLATLATRDRTEQLEYGARVYNFLANAYRRSGRDLEAAMAFHAGVDANPDDPEYTEKNANGYRAMISSLAKLAPNDDFLKEQLAAAEKLYLEHAGDATSNKWRILMSKALEKEREELWDEAIEIYRTIAATDNDYVEKARVAIGVALFNSKRGSEALKTFNEYLEWANNPANTVDSPVRKQKRAEALATAEFYKGLILYLVARKSKAQADWEKVSALFDGFPDRHPQQTKLAPVTVRYLMEARLGLGDLEGARKAMDQLVADYKDSSSTAKASVTYYNALKKLRDAAASEEEKTQLLREMAGFLKIANSILSPDFKRLRYESLHWLELGEYGEAERVLSALSSQFATDASHAADLTSKVLPDLGAALLENNKVEEAKAILAPLVMDESAKPTKRTVLNFSRAVAGWLIGGGPGNPVQEVAGAGGSDEEFQAAVDALYRIWQRDKWQCQWYEYRLMHLWTYVAWSRQDSRKKEVAKSQFTQFKAVFDKPGYIQVDQACEEDPDPALRARLGGGVLQSRLQYLERQVK